MGWRLSVFTGIWGAGVLAASVVALVLGPPVVRSHRPVLAADRDQVKALIQPSASHDEDS